MIMRWKEDHEYYKRMLEKSEQLNVENAIVTKVFQDECYFSSDDKNESYYSDEVSTSSNEHSILDLNDRAAEEKSLDKKSISSLDDKEESEPEYNIDGNKDTVYENSVSDDNNYT